jgi:hypothetical protein
MEFTQVDSLKTMSSVTSSFGDSILGKLLITTIASVLTWTFLKFLEKVAYPWYEEISYRGLKVSGQWQATLTSEETKFHEDFEINQRGHELSGTYTIKNEFATGGHQFSSYKLNGKIINNHVTFTCYVKSQREIGIATFILEIVDGGQSLEGKSLWINRVGKEILCFDNYKITRV